MAKPVASLPKQVREVFESDGVLHEAIRREFVNYRALSRWMIETHGLQGSEDAVLSAIRRLRREPESDPFRAARVVLAQCHLNIRSRACQVLVPKSDEARRKLPQMVQFVDFSKGEMLYFTWGESGLKILLDESNLEGVQNLFGAHGRRVVRNLASITVAQPEAGLNTPGILALMSETLALHGINVVDAVYGFPDYAFFVRESDTLRTYQALEALVQSSAQKPLKGRKGAAATPSTPLATNSA